MQKVAVVGFGAMGQMHASCYQNIDGVEVSAIVDAHPDEAKKKLKKMGLKAKVFSNIDDMLEQGDINIVDICLPTDLHVPLGLKAVAAGKHVFVEKPLSFTVEEASTLIEAAKKNKVFLMVGHCIRFWPEYQFLYDCVKDKTYGKLNSIAFQRRASRPTYSKQNWLQNGKRSGGAIFDLHIHDADFICHLLGKPKAVASVGSEDASGWSHVFTNYYYKNVAVTAEGAWLAPTKWGFNMSWQAYFDDAVLEFDFSKSPTLKLTVGDKAPKDLALKAKQAKNTKNLSGNISDMGGYINELTYFVDCVKTKKAPKISTGLQAAESVKLILAEIESLESGKKVDFK